MIEYIKGDIVELTPNTDDHANVQGLATNLTYL